MSGQKPTVVFGAAQATNVSVTHAREIVCTTPAGSIGAVNVIVTNPDAQSGTLTNGYTYFMPSPTITTVSPTNGPETLFHLVTITGTNFFTGATVQFGSSLGTIQSISPGNTTIVVTTPTTESGAVSLTVTNVGGTPPFVTWTSSYTFNPPPAVQAR